MIRHQNTLILRFAFRRCLESAPSNEMSTARNGQDTISAVKELLALRSNVTELDCGWRNFPSILLFLFVLDYYSPDFHAVVLLCDILGLEKLQTRDMVKLGDAYGVLAIYTLFDHFQQSRASFSSFLSTKLTTAICFVYVFHLFIH